MKTIYILPAFLLIALITVAQTNYVKDGLTYSKDGKLMNGRCVQITDGDLTEKVYFYKDGLLNGEFLMYASNGNLLERGNYLNGEKHGKWTSWTEEGIKTGEINFEEGLKDGKWQIWDESGVLRYVMFYEVGEKVGTWQVYAENGDLLKEKEYTRTL